MSLLQPTVVVIADDPEFARQVAERWQSERQVPALTILRSDIGAGCGEVDFHLAVVGPACMSSLAPVVKALAAKAPGAILVTDDASTAQWARSEFPRLLVLREHEGWLDTLVQLGGEVLRRMEAQGRMMRSEAAQTTLKRNAVLGQFMIEMRHSLNNALTSVLGNSELLLLEPGAMGGMERAQVATIRNMGLRMHEILQRFTSLEKELTAMETHSDWEWQGQKWPAAY
jgi:signal transduction histidine kinase